MAEQIFEFCKRRGIGCTCLHGDKVIETQPGKTPLVFSVWADHAYFYEDKAVRRRLAQRQACDYQQVKREFPESKTPAFDEWKEYKTPPEPGHFWVLEDQMDAVRADFLYSGRHPKCVLRSESSIKSLTYTFVRGEQHKGRCVIH